MTTRQPSWDKYEAAILLDGLLATIRGEITRADAIKRVSQDLRKMAICRGVEIDEFYRNENGISFQMHSMESAFYGRTLFKPATKLFIKVANLYHESQSEYNKLLKEAKEMVNGSKPIENNFMQYLAEKVSPGQLSELYWCYSEIEAFCFKLKILQQPLFQTTDFEVIKKVQRTIEQNKIFRVTHRKHYKKIISAGRHYYTYIKDGLFQQSIQESTSKVSSSVAGTVISAEDAIMRVQESEKEVDISITRSEQDERLLQKYPIIYKRVFKALRELTMENSQGATIGEIGKRINQIARPAVIEEILDNASWSMAVGIYYVFSVEIVNHTVAIDETETVLVSYKNEPYKAILKQHFQNGFRLESLLEIRKFRKLYAEMYNVELVDSDDEISRKIKELCIIYDGKAFIPDVMLSKELKKKLLKYIEDSFSNGKTAIYYQALYAEFSEAFLDYHIHNADMLKVYLTFIGDGRFYINRSCISNVPNVKIDPLAEIRACLQSYGRPVEYEELFAALPHLPQNKIKFILASNGEFINNGHGAYFHESVVRISEKDLKNISDIIEQTIAEKGFIGGNELYDAIKAKYPHIIDENQAFSIYGFRDALKAKLGNIFSFKGNIISRYGHELSMADVFSDYARKHDSFTLSELQVLASNLATVIYFDSVYENSLRISKDQFVSKDNAQFSVYDTDEAIDRVCAGKYIPIKEVTNFGIFPHAGFPWNSFLLEHYVADYSQKYMLFHSSFNATDCAGAIVKRSAGISSFDDLIVDLLVNSNIEMKKEPVLQFLNDKGYLARRRYSNIELLILKANALKKQKEKD